MGHEGRHRATILASMGYRHIPVVLSSSNIRWSEQNDPSNRFDYIQDWPTRLISENGQDSMRFPVRREDADKTPWNQ